MIVMIAALDLGNLDYPNYALTLVIWVIRITGVTLVTWVTRITKGHVDLDNLGNRDYYRHIA